MTNNKHVALIKAVAKTLPISLGAIANGFAWSGAARYVSTADTNWADKELHTYLMSYSVFLTNKPKPEEIIKLVTTPSELERMPQSVVAELMVIANMTEEEVRCAEQAEHDRNVVSAKRNEDKLKDLPLLKSTIKHMAKTFSCKKLIAPPPELTADEDNKLVAKILDNLEERKQRLVGMAINPKMRKKVNLEMGQLNLVLQAA